MATKEALVARLKVLEGKREALRQEVKDAAAATKAAAIVNKSKTLTAALEPLGDNVRLAKMDGAWTVIVSGSGGSKSASRSRRVGVEDWIVDGKSIESAMPSKVIQAIGANYGADSPERYLDKHVKAFTAHKVAAVVGGKEIPIEDFVKANPA